MELESVRALKEEARQRVQQLWQEVPLHRALGVRAQDVGRVSRPRTIAIGVAVTAANDYKLAIRVQNPLLIGGRQVAALHDLAKGEVDLRYIGGVRKSQQPSPLQGNVRPLRPGASVGHVRVTAGSIGAFVQSEGQTMILSNNHVLANENLAAAGDNVLQPGHANGGMDPAHAVATPYQLHPSRLQQSEHSGLCRSDGQRRNSDRCRQSRFAGSPGRGAHCAAGLK